MKRYNPYAYYSLLLLSCVSLGYFAVWALCAPDSLMAFIGLEANTTLAKIEFQSFYFGMEAGIILFLLLPKRWVMPQQKLWVCLATFGCTGLCRISSMYLHAECSHTFIGIAAFEIGSALWALALLCRPQSNPSVANSAQD